MLEDHYENFWTWRRFTLIFISAPVSPKLKNHLLSLVLSKINQLFWKMLQSEVHLIFWSEDDLGSKFSYIQIWSRLSWEVKIAKIIRIENSKLYNLFKKSPTMLIRKRVMKVFPIFDHEKRLFFLYLPSKFSHKVEIRYINLVWVPDVLGGGGESSLPQPSVIALEI